MDNKNVNLPWDQPEDHLSTETVCMELVQGEKPLVLTPPYAGLEAAKRVRGP